MDRGNSAAYAAESVSSPQSHHLSRLHQIRPHRPAVANNPQRRSAPHHPRYRPDKHCPSPQSAKVGAGRSVTPREGTHCRAAVRHISTNTHAVGSVKLSWHERSNQRVQILHHPHASRLTHESCELSKSFTRENVAAQTITLLLPDPHIVGPQTILERNTFSPYKTSLSRTIVARHVVLY